jgi:hypothetical protein
MDGVPTWPNMQTDQTFLGAFILSYSVTYLAHPFCMPCRHRLIGAPQFQHYPWRGGVDPAAAVAALFSSVSLCMSISAGP